MAADANATSPTFRPLADRDRLWGTGVNTTRVLHANRRRVAQDLLRLFLANKTPIILWGPVGARKTRTIQALGREVDENGVPYQVITLQPSTQDPTIIHGMMFTAEENGQTVMRRSVPHVAEQVYRYAEEQGGLTILFADEMTTCMPAQQNAMLGLLTHGRFEDIDISPYITIAMAANPEGTVSTVIPLNEAVLNRAGHVAWFGDRELFLSQWSDGFGGATTPPKPSTVDLVRTVFAQHPDKVFRADSDRWTPDTLVPWDMMEHTERAVTETARMIELVEDVFAHSPQEVREFYIIAVTEALLGPQWAQATAAVFDQRSESASLPKVLEWVRKVGHKQLGEAVSLDELIEQDRPLWPDELRQDQASEFLSRLIKKTTNNNGTFSHDHYLAAWAFVSSAPDEASASALSSQLKQLADIGAAAFGDGDIPRQLAAPKFIPPHVRTALARARSTD